ncbi:MAG TPA: ABC transporter permease subunit, partial [Candidatus Acidoferrales bacterium]|nr:ABC transporter permease subunit [Candidatus Acidoferrales bacterium]
FKFEQVESAAPPRSALLALLRRTGVAASLYRKIVRPVGERLTLAFSRRGGSPAPGGRPAAWRRGLERAFGAALLVTLGYAAVRAGLVLAALTPTNLLEIARGAGVTFLRVQAALLIGAAWTVPAGVAIGSSPRLARLAQPLAQIAASVPATALFPVVLLVLTRAGGAMGLASILLMILGTQWYILFNVIAGAMAIPADLKEAAGIFRFGSWDRWRKLTLPAIFPYLVTGMLTASGGAWNASIVAEYFHFKGEIRSTLGLGATISRATDAGQFQVLLGGTIAMAAIVVTLNRLAWQRLYGLAETRFKLET